MRREASRELLEFENTVNCLDWVIDLKTIRFLLLRLDNATPSSNLVYF